MWHARPKRDDLSIRELDLPGLPFGELSTREPPPRKMIEHGLRRDLERRRCALDRIAAIRPAERVSAHPVDLDRRDAPALAQEPDGLALDAQPRAAMKPSRFSAAAISLSIWPAPLSALTRRRSRSTSM